MKILHTRVLRGPNRWSGYRRRLIECRLDLEKLEDSPTNRIPGFADRLEELIPSLVEHECSEKRPGGFFNRVRQGTWMGHVIEHIALELQSLAGMPCGYGRTRSAGPRGVYYVVFSYEIAAAGLSAAGMAVSLVESLVAGEDYDVRAAVEELQEVRSRFGYSSLTRAILEQAKLKNIPAEVRDDNDRLILGQGICAQVMPLSKGHPVLPALEQEVLFEHLAENGIPVRRDIERPGRYQLFVLHGRLLSGVEIQGGEPVIIFMEQVQLNRIHSVNVFLFEKIARLSGMDQCTITLDSPDLGLPYTTGETWVTGLQSGTPRQWPAPAEKLIAVRILEQMFSKGGDGRIPVVAVTGTNGKTTTTRLIAHMAKTAGYQVGFTNTDGIYVNDHRISAGDCSGPASAAMILRDPSVDFAVFECARGGILRSGLGFDKCDISVVTNIKGDHLGLDGIHTNQQMARIKAVVPNSTFDGGFAVLNSEDDLVYDLRKELDCNLALFGMRMNERLERHMQMGGLVCYIENGSFVVCWHGCRSELGRVKETPLTYQGRAECMIRNILPCLCVAMIRNFSIASIREALESFIPGPEFTPGRMNIFSFSQFDVMVDYAHNPDGLREMRRFLRNTEASRKVGIIGCPGDRLDQDLKSMGYLAAGMFDEIIIRHDEDGRGRTREQVTDLIMQGISAADRDISVTVISEEKDALRQAMSAAVDGSLIVTCTEKVDQTIAFLEEEIAKENSALSVKPVFG